MPTYRPPLRMLVALLGIKERRCASDSDHAGLFEVNLYRRQVIATQDAVVQVTSEAHVIVDGTADLRVQLDAALEDGVVTPKERSAILSRATRLDRITHTHEHHLQELC